MVGTSRTAVIEALTHLPLVGGFVRRKGWYPWRHQWVLWFGPRENVTFTQFLRLPRQYDALCGPVIEFLRPANAGEPLRILIFGCSNGAEPVSIASTLLKRRPGVAFDIVATDIEPGMIAKASGARYTRDEVNKMALLDPAFVAATFIERDDDFEVRPEIRARITFQIADVLDPQVTARLGQADIVVAQNFLYHLPRARSRLAFAHICSAMKPRSALFVDGMDIDMRPALTRKAGLQPLDHLIPEIHSDSAVLRGPPWPWIYWSLEPFDDQRRDWKQRYATIYLRGVV
jgi:chemotaxis protein methyltransferase CheR